MNSCNIYIFSVWTLYALESSFGLELSLFAFKYTFEELVFLCIINLMWNFVKEMVADCALVFCGYDIFFGC